jgi:glycosyltransferase involved in cell wall biosynthesis
MKILQICSSGSWGGMEMHVCALANALQEQGFDISVAAAADSNIDLFCKEHDLPFFKFQPSGYLSPLCLFRLFRLLKRENFDIIHIHYSLDLWSVIPANLTTKIPVVFIKHIGTAGSKKDPFHRFLYSRVCCNIAISRVIAENLKQTHPIDPERIRVVHHGIRLQMFDAAADARQRIRTEFSIAPDEFLIGHIGRLQIGKGHLEFLQMAADIRKQYQKVKFIVIGEPTRGEEDKAKVIYQRHKELALEDIVLMPGFRRDIPELLSAMDIFVFPSHAEAFGLVLIEAMAAGLAVVSSNCDGVLDIVEHGKEGLLVPPRDYQALSGAVKTLLDHPEERKRMAMAARTRVEKQFTFDKMIEKIIQIYNNCID